MFPRLLLRRVLPAILLAFATTPLHAQPKPNQDDTKHGVRRPAALPKTALMVEARMLPDRPERALILWMMKPETHPNETTPDEVYTCPEHTRGSYYSGPTRISLVDTKAGTIMNTIEIKADDSDGEDSLDIPYAIRGGYYYKVEGDIKKGVEGEPRLLAFEDRNGDGKAHEFALYDAPACMGLATTLIGYSERRDQVVQYPIELKTERGGKKGVETSLWANELFARKATSRGKWNFEVDYRGRGGPLDKYEIAYNSEKELFAGTLKSEGGEEDEGDSSR